MSGGVSDLIDWEINECDVVTSGEFAASQDSVEFLEEGKYLLLEVLLSVLSILILGKEGNES